MRRLVVAPVLLAAVACGGSDPVGIELEVEPEACNSDCAVRARGSGLLVRGEAAASAPDGLLTLYGEAALPDGTAVVEISFLGPSPARARYREVADGAVRFTGRVFDLEATPPGHDGVTAVAGRFRFAVEADDGEVRRVRGAILPATGEAVRVERDSPSYVHSPTYASCDGEIYLPPPDPDETSPLPDDTWTPPAPSMPSSGTDMPTDPAEDPRNLPDEDRYAAPADSGCDGDTYEDPSDEGYEAMAAADSGCDGDSYDDEDYEDMGSTDDAGCEGDDYGDMGSSGGVMSMALPIFGSMWRLTWPLGLAGLFNRRSRRRVDRSPP